MMYIIYILLGLTALGIFSKKGKNVIKFVSILIETIQNKKTELTPELLYLHLAPIIKFGDLYINGVNTHHHYDIICFSSNREIQNETYNYNPNNDIISKIPISLIRSGICLGSIPFRPCDFNQKTLYIAIKRISHTDYTIYNFKEKEYINLNEIFDRFEKDLKSSVQNPQQSFLAEAYD